MTWPASRRSGCVELCGASKCLLGFWARVTIATRSRVRWRRPFLSPFGALAALDTSAWRPCAASLEAALLLLRVFLAPSARPARRNSSRPRCRRAPLRRVDYFSARARPVRTRRRLRARARIFPPTRAPLRLLPPVRFSTRRGRRSSLAAAARRRRRGRARSCSCAARRARARAAWPRW